MAMPSLMGLILFFVVIYLLVDDNSAKALKWFLSVAFDRFSMVDVAGSGPFACISRAGGAWHCSEAWPYASYLFKEQGGKIQRVVR